MRPLKLKLPATSANLGPGFDCLGIAHKLYNRITVERQKFNDVVQSYNTTVKAFPGVMLAGTFGFSPKPYFTAQAGAETPPKVDFSLGAANPALGKP